MPLFLYSTNSYLKFHVQELYRNQRHHVWCCDSFDGSTLSAYASGKLIPPSSNPADIYRQLKAEAGRGDRHGDKITSQRAILLALATKWLTAGEITEKQASEIAYLAKDSEATLFRPLLYVIPFDLVRSRVVIVPIEERAHPMAEEYRVADLHRSEFDIVEF